MSDATWGVIGVVIGGILAAGSGFLTTWLASRNENFRWKQEKKLEHLKVRISELTPILINGAAIIDSYEQGNRTGLPIQQGVESVVMITSMSSKSSMLWKDVIKAAKDKEENRHAVYTSWLNSIASDIVDAKAEIERLLS